MTCRGTKDGTAHMLIQINITSDIKFVKDITVLNLRRIKTCQKGTYIYIYIHVIMFKPHSNPSSPMGSTLLVSSLTSTLLSFTSFFLTAVVPLSTRKPTVALHKGTRATCKLF